MHVSVVKAGQDSSALEIHDQSAGPSELRDIRCCADGYDPVSGDSHRFSFFLLSIHGPNLAIYKKQSDRFLGIRQNAAGTEQNYSECRRTHVKARATQGRIRTRRIALLLQDRIRSVRALAV